MTDYAAKSADKKPSSRESTRYGSVASSGTASALAPVEFAVVSEDRRKDSFFFLTGLYSAVFLFLTASFPLYFYFTPDFSASDIRPALLMLYVITWPIAVFVPVVLLWTENMAEWSRFKSTIYLVSVLGWPVITLVIKIRGLIAFGDAGIGYWSIYPIFILLEVLWPILAVAMWVFTRENVRAKLQLRSELRQEFKKELRVREGKRA